jgi:hypothetical protein
MGNYRHNHQLLLAKFACMSLMRKGCILILNTHVPRSGERSPRPASRSHRRSSSSFYQNHHHHLH